MKDLLEITGIIALILGLFFLFAGEPDVWDVLHAKAMGSTCQKVEVKHD